MEDPNGLVADCIVISCCCQCLVLQLLIFLLLKLPWKLFCKTRDLAKRRLKKTGRKLGKSVAEIVENRAMVKLYSLSSREGSSSRRSGGACMEEVDKALEELAQQEKEQNRSMAMIETDQLKQLRDIFNRFDMDRDGSLTHLELAALLRSLGLKPTGDQLHDLVHNIDANNNGSVEFEELVEAIMPDMNEEILVNQEQLMEVFRSFDRDGNGYITAAELAGSMAKMGHPLTYGELTKMMREADADGDGVISFDEFTTIMARSASDFLGIAAA